MFIQYCPSRRWCGQRRPLFSQGLEKTIVIQNFELNLYSNLRLINASHNGIEAQRLKMLGFHIGARDSWKSREKENREMRMRIVSQGCFLLQVKSRAHSRSTICCKVDMLFPPPSRLCREPGLLVIPATLEDEE